MAAEGEDTNVTGNHNKDADYVVGLFEWGPSRRIVMEIRRRRPVYVVDEDLSSCKCNVDRLVGYLLYV